MMSVSPTESNQNTPIATNDIEHDQDLEDHSQFMGEEDNNPFLGLSNSSYLFTTNNEQTLIESESVPSSKLSKLLRSNVVLDITDATNSNESVNNSTKKYILYTIRLHNLENVTEEVSVRRRYSDFESLREVLSKIFPLTIIPPIPIKNYFDFSKFNLVSPSHSNSATHSSYHASYAMTESSSSRGVIPSSRLNINTTDKLIERRKRLLNNFLNGCFKIDEIRKLEIFAKFLDPSANWSDELALIQNQLPKSIYLSNPQNCLKTESMYINLPDPSRKNAMTFLKKNQRMISETTYKLLSNNGENGTSPNGGEVVTNDPKLINTHELDELNKKIMTNFTGLTIDYSELGSILNSFSVILSESIRKEKNRKADELSAIFDKIGQTFDRSFICLTSLIEELDTKYSEPLGEAVQYSTIMQGVLKFQTKKVRQKALLDNELYEKRKVLTVLDGQNQDSKHTNGSSHQHSKFRILPSMKKISRYVSDIIDQNPQQTRIERIANLNGKIKILERCQEIMLIDLDYITRIIDKNYHEFQKSQARTIYEILHSYNQYLISWAKKNIEIWTEVRNELSK